MTLSATRVRPADALDQLGRAITSSKGIDPLSHVTVIVPTNTCGVMARRALGRRTGLVGVDMVTLNRLAEVLAGPALAAAGRSPMSSAVLDLAIGRVLRRQPGSFREVASHPSTIVAIRQVHGELRAAGPAALEQLEQHSARGREVARISRAVTTQLESAWYDEGDLFAYATAAIATTGAATPRAVVVYLPEHLSGLAVAFVNTLSERTDVHLITTDVDVTGIDGTESRADAALHRVRVISTTDADDEVRIATRAVIDAARSGTPFERIAILWPSERPYARLVEHHLTIAGIRWNGRPGTTVTERLAPRLVLDLLDIDRRGLRRDSLFSLFADVPPRAADGSFLPTAAWERVSRDAGVARDEDWSVRLGALTVSEKRGPAATSLLGFVSDLRGALGHQGHTRRWSEWAEWCVTQLDAWVGRHRLEHLADVEFRAWEALSKAIDRLRHLDPIGEPVTRHAFRAALLAELEALPGRVGRVGDGVTVGSLGGAIGLDVDLVVVLGAAEGSLPPRPAGDPLLSAGDRAAAGLDAADERIARMHQHLMALSDTADLTFTLARGDLRATAHAEPSRWLSRWADRAEVRTVDSHTSGLTATVFPASPGEHRLRSRYAHVRSGASLDTADVAGDIVLERALTLVAGRASGRLTEYDGDLSSTAVPRLDTVISPTQLETWPRCPHAYFLRYLLHVVPIEEPGAEISITALDRGSTHHDVLDRFHRAVIRGELPQPGGEGWTTIHRTALMRIFEEETERTQRRGRTGRHAYWSDERERMRADLLGWLDHDSDTAIERGSIVIESEYRFGLDDAGSEAEPDVGLDLPDGRRIRLRGSVDRIDRTASGTIVVTDHKTGRADKYRHLGADNPTLDRTVFQLPAYAAAARALLDDPNADVITEYGMMGKGNYQRPGYTLTASVAATVAEELALVVSGIEAGFFPNRPERPGWRMFIECEYCDPDHLGTGTRWREWSHKRTDPRLARWFAPPETATV